jgi:hypothetical protein
MRVFISHVREDAPVAEALARAIAERGHEVVARDSGDAALTNSDAMIVLVSPQSVASHFVQREIEFALASPRFAQRLIPVVIAKTPQAPWILRKLPSFPVGSDLTQTGRRVVEALEKTA